jgi:hypothetical protein
MVHVASNDRPRICAEDVSVKWLLYLLNLALLASALQLRGVFLGCGLRFDSFGATIASSAL